MYCKECGKEIPDDSKFCNKCGKMITDGEEVKTEAETPTQAQSVSGGCLKWCIWAVVLLTALIWICEGCAMFM